MLHYFTYVKEALRNEIAFQAWDDGGQFRIYDRELRKWPEVKDILIHTYVDGPEKLKAQYINDSQAYLTWKNNNGQCSKIIIEKKIDLKNCGILFTTGSYIAPLAGYLSWRHKIKFFIQSIKKILWCCPII